MNGDKYLGDWNNNQKHGKGVYEYSNGDRYEGLFSDGKR